MGEASEEEASEEESEAADEASDEEYSDESASGSEEESSDEESSEEASSAGDVLSAKKTKTEEIVTKDNSKPAPTEQSLRFYTGRDGTRFGKTFRQLEQGWVGVGSSSECHPLSQPKNPKRCHFEKAPQPVTGKIGRSPAKANRRKR